MDKNVPEVESNSPELSKIFLLDNRRKPAQQIYQQE